MFLYIRYNAHKMKFTDRNTVTVCPYLPITYPSL